MMMRKRGAGGERMRTITRIFIIIIIIGVFILS